MISSEVSAADVITLTAVLALFDSFGRAYTTNYDVIIRVCFTSASGQDLNVIAGYRRVKI